MKKQTQNKPNSRNVQIDVNLVKTRNYNNEQQTMNYELLCKTNPNKPNFLKLTGLDYFLFCEYFAGEIIGKGNLYRQGFFKALDFVGYLKSQSVINRYNCGKPELF